MSKSLQKPTILNVETVARSRLFTVESVDLEFSNGVRRVYERMRPTNREAVMIVPIVDDHLILIREYAVGTESYELGICLFLEQWEEERSELRAYNSTQAAYKRWKEQTLAYYAANAVRCTEPEELDRDERIARRTELLEKEYGKNESNE